MIGESCIISILLDVVISKNEVTARLLQLPGAQSPGLIGSGSNQITLTDATVRKIFKLAAQRAAGKKDLSQLSLSLFLERPRSA